MATEAEELDALAREFGEGARVAAAPKKRTRKGKAPSVPADLQGRIAGFYRAVGTGASWLGQPEDGAIIAGAADDIAAAWLDVAKQNPSVAKAWVWLTSGGAWTKVIAAHGAIAIPIMIRHHVIEPDFIAKLFRPKEPAPEVEPVEWGEKPDDERRDEIPGVVTAGVTTGIPAVE